jgi:hypothetical protein
MAGYAKGPEPVELKHLNEAIDDKVSKMEITNARIEELQVNRYLDRYILIYNSNNNIILILILLYYNNYYYRNYLIHQNQKKKKCWIFKYYLKNLYLLILLYLMILYIDIFLMHLMDRVVIIIVVVNE